MGVTLSRITLSLTRLGDTISAAVFPPPPQPRNMDWANNGDWSANGDWIGIN